MPDTLEDIVLDKVGLGSLGAQTPTARCDLADTQEAGMVLTVNGQAYQLSEREGVALEKKLHAALMRRLTIGWG